MESRLHVRAISCGCVWAIRPFCRLVTTTQRIYNKSATSTETAEDYVTSPPPLPPKTGGQKRNSSSSHNIHFLIAAADDVKVDYKFLADSLVIFMEMGLHIQDFMFISESFFFPLFRLLAPPPRSFSTGNFKYQILVKFFFSFFFAFGYRAAISVLDSISFRNELRLNRNRTSILLFFFASHFWIVLIEWVWLLMVWWEICVFNCLLNFFVSFHWQLLSDTKQGFLKRLVTF